ncbi:MAG: hypothetical protein Q9162_002255 [Coniocarpon cinnabarinum]
MPGMTRVTHTEESAEVEVLLANMEKLKGLTKKIHGSLGRLDSSGRSVQAAIRPIYGNTSRLQVTNSNIEKINQAIENIRQPLDRRRKEEDVIRAGLGRIELADYVASMDRSSQALENLRNTNLKSNQEAIAELTYILKFGTAELENAFRDTLQQEAAPLEPLRYITKGQPFPMISEQNSSKLRYINKYMTNSPSQRPMQQSEDLASFQIYSEIRGPYLSTSLQNLAQASVSTVRKTDSSAIYRQGTSGIGTYATALEQMFAVEYENICPIFNREQWVRLHSLTTNDATSQLFSVLKDLHSHIKHHVITDCFLAFEIVEIVNGLSFRLEGKNPELRQPVQDALRPIRETAKYSLSRLYDDTKSRVNALMSLPPDGTAVPLTGETMQRLQTMTSYLQPLSSILASVGEGGWRGGSSAGAASKLDVGVSGNELFSAYADDMIGVLLQGIESKAKSMLKGKSHQGVFLANNATVVERMIFTSDLTNLVADATRNRLNDMLKKGVTLYTDAFKECAGYLRDVLYTNRTSGTGRPASNSISGSTDSMSIVKNLSSKDRDATKEKFKNFNQSFDEIMARCRGLKMENEVRDLMVKEVVQFVEPLYDRFWDRYHEIDKGKGKYVKYDKKGLRQALHSL